MATHDIAIIPGDGIGPEVTAEAFKVLDAAAEVFGFKLNKKHYPFSSQHFLDTGDIWPDADFEEVKGMGAIYLGAIGDPRIEVGKMEFGIIARARIDLDLYLNIRPIKLYDERLCPLKGKGPADVDMVIVRENTEGAYTGMHGFAHKGQDLEVATQTMVWTRAGVERAVRHAFELARSRGGRKHVTLIDKANALRAQDLWIRVFALVAAEYPDISTGHDYIDAACMRMVDTPEDYDVAVTSNLFGDIITDLGAMIQGGLGIAASANIHPGQVSLFEPVHGSFPEAAGKNTASPIAAILAGSMMLDFLGEQEASNAIETTVIDLFTSRRLKGVRAADHPTNEVGELVVAEVRRLGTPA
jgi:3-isopropylmalate dehydrogenase